MASIGEQALKYLKSLSKEGLRTFLDEIADEVATDKPSASGKNMWIMGGVEDRPHELGLEPDMQGRPRFTDKIEISIEDSAASHPEEMSTTFRYKSETYYQYDPHFDDLDIAS